MIDVERELQDEGNCVRATGSGKEACDRVRQRRFFDATLTRLLRSRSPIRLQLPAEFASQTIPVAFFSEK
jgi:hypothetical protein